MTHSLTAPKILLEGDSGGGKTYAIGTLVDWAAKQTPKVQIFVVFVENGLETLLGYWRDRKLPIPDNLHWHEIPSAALGLEALIAGAKDVGMLTYEGLTKQIDPNRGTNNPAYKFLQIFADFPDDRTGEKYGNVGKWGADKFLCIDSLTETAVLYEKMCIGNKPVMSQPEYLVAQNNLMNFLRYMCAPSNAFGFLMTAHLQKQMIEATGTVMYTIKAIGKAISDDIPKLFSEVILCRREGTSWHWDTLSPGVVTKTRYLPLSQKLPPDCGTIMEKWKARASE